jgi:hypothetical protein
MTDSEMWKAIPGYPFYEVSDCGRVRSIPREANGRTYRSVVMSTRPSNSGYVLVDVRNAEGKKETRTMHTLVLAAFAGQRPHGHEARHLNGDPLDNRAENLVWGTKAENEEDKFAHGRPRAAEKPPKVCPRCQAEHRDPGRRCHACVAEVGEEAARLLVAGVPLDQVAERLDYPSLGGLLTLAQRYGGLRLVLASPSAAAPPSRSAHGPLATLRHRLRRGHSQ